MLAQAAIDDDDVGIDVGRRRPSERGSVQHLDGKAQAQQPLERFQVCIGYDAQWSCCARDACCATLATADVLGAVFDGGESLAEFLELTSETSIPVPARRLWPPRLTIDADGAVEATRRCRANLRSSGADRVV